MKSREIISSVVKSSVGDYSLAFKLLGFIMFLEEEGPDPFLAGEVLSTRNYHRWIGCLGRAGLQDVALDARMRQLVREYIWGRFRGLPINQARERVLEAVASMVDEVKAPSLQAKSRQASDAVKGERSEIEDRESKTSALDGDATGGRLEKAMAPNVLENTPAM